MILHENECGGDKIDNTHNNKQTLLVLSNKGNVCVCMFPCVISKN